MAAFTPLCQFFVEEKVMCRVALAEQQPVARARMGGTFAQVRTQSGNARAVADQDEWCGGVRAVECGIAADAQIDLFANGRVAA